ncbi:DEAD/DEAH box helicase [Legionella micdadei]|uniref:DEAD-box ATP-dependent RNA helicase RhpA n=1 Tax=Legionella micdadei TaxID=451 RepID=A0A098GEV3_LEGMI|nr:DEAD/DEAH box helicase [Legionella micdadei]ARG98308.1 ATP-dependent RNA helicase RhlE [Legionella micdadei]ARH01059.1 ATP-dependent RNA helicase RhlE [Legionella micdadei]KTD27239.1 ATP-dependent RNA helicase RhlE [Legionella micdadei]NSL18626.1 DEAD/DEAH box helicase [Legionella micdadei]CEG60021.1 ATP-dependent RNA helicase rhlE [Legionella micdadei]
MSFASLGLIEPLLRAVSELGYLDPSPIQIQAIPAVLRGKDVLASAQTGTGKTASFVLPILQKLKDKPRARNNRTRVLIITPTRELAAQIHESIIQYGCHLSLRSAVVFGGVKINPQMMKLRGGVELLVATPGRLLDLHQQRAILFDEVDILVLDEADRMLDMGFIHDIKRVIKLLPANRQNLMFSATFSEEIRALVKGILKEPIVIDVAPRNTTAATIKQTVHPVDKSRKSALLSHLIHKNKLGQTLVFSRTKHGANKLVKQLAQDHIHAAAIHGNKSQSQRTKALAEFKSGELHILVATDIAARGIDIDQLPCVINFDLPQVAEDYVHRIGRTGRAGASGQAISLVSADEAAQLNAIERLIKRRLDRIEIEDFEPNHNLPNSPSPAQTKKNSPKRNKATAIAERAQKQRFGKCK